MQIANEGTPGCSVSMQGQIRVLFYTVPRDAPCDIGNHPDSLLTTWRGWVDAYNPDVVVYLARGETFDQNVGGQWQNLGRAAFDRYVESRYRRAVTVLGSRGASVVLMTTPFYDSGVPPNGGAWPEDDPARVSMRQRDHADGGGHHTGGSRRRQGLRVRPQHRGLTGAAVRGQCRAVNVRCTDGVHFTRSGGIDVGIRLAPELAALGQAHAASSPGGTWPGSLPPSTPSWFPNLPCQ